MDEINSVQNERVKQWGKLQQKKYRDKTGQFLIEGEHLIEEALKYHCIDHLLLLNSLEHSFKYEKNTILVSQEILDKLSQNQSQVSMIAVCHLPKWQEKQYKKGILLDGVQDPGNLGTIIRTALSFGYDFITLSKDCVDLCNDKCIRATQGAMFQIPITREDLMTKIKELKKEDFTVLGTALHQAVPLKELKRPEKFVLIMGNEGQGIKKDILACTDKNIFVEMERFESLNVGVAAGICMYMLK